MDEYYPQGEVFGKSLTLDVSRISLALDGRDVFLEGEDDNNGWLRVDRIEDVDFVDDKTRDVWGNVEDETRLFNDWVEADVDEVFFDGETVGIEDKGWRR